MVDGLSLVRLLDGLPGYPNYTAVGFEEGGIPLATPHKLASMLHSLPPILYIIRILVPMN